MQAVWSSASEVHTAMVLQYVLVGMMSYLYQLWC